MAYDLTTSEKVWQERRVRSSYSYPVPNVITRATGTMHTVSRRRIGERNTNYKEKIARGEQATTVYSLEASKMELVGGYASRGFNDPSNGTTWVDEFWGVNEVISPNPAHLSVSAYHADAAALSLTYKKVLREQQQLNSPAVIAEFLDVLRMFGRPYRAVTDLVNRHVNRLALASRGLSGSTSFRKQQWLSIAANVWAETAFGLQPLISDTKKAAIALARYNLEQERLSRPRAKVVGRGGNENSTTYTSRKQCPSVSMWTVSNIKTETQASAQYVVGLKSDILAEFGSNERLMQLLGFNPSNWIPALWEAVPYSWLVDYFSNVGAILESAATSQAGIVWVSKTAKTRTVQTYTNVFDLSRTGVVASYSAKWNAVTHGGYATVTRTSMTRTPMQSLGIIPLVIEHPFEDVKKMLNLAAVALSRAPAASKLWIS